jgi:L-asparaginase II
MRLTIDVHVRRGSITEARHRVLACACTPSGETVAATDQPDAVTSLRSAAKPFQLLPLVERGHADRFGFTAEQLAIMAASHTGSAYHLELVRGILDRLGLDPGDLACGYHDPVDADAHASVIAKPETKSPLHNNCSGKHAGMLALALAEGWPTDGYHRAEHPLQQLMRRMVAETCDVADESIAVGIDGCSVSVFGIPLSAMARGYARLAAAREGRDARETSLHRIREAMLAYPIATGGTGRFSSSLMSSAGTALVAKGGAEGLECIGIIGRGIGVALKCEDGSARAVAPAAVALLERLDALPAGALSALESFRHPVLRNAAGVEAARLEVEIRSSRAGAVAC